MEQVVLTWKAVFPKAKCKVDQLDLGLYQSPMICCRTASVDLTHPLKRVVIGVTRTLGIALPRERLTAKVTDAFDTIACRKNRAQLW